MSDSKIEGHEYDGIQELDNSLPRWWLTTFYATMVFGGLYFGYYILGSGPDHFQEVDRDLARIELARLLEKPAEPSGPSEDELKLVFADNARKDKGHEVYKTKCASCHGVQGEGGIGPNLTDGHAIHGAKPGQILKTVAQGVLDKGMPPWEAVLSQDDLYNVSVYAYRLLGTNAPNGKAPQGEAIAK